MFEFSYDKRKKKVYIYVKRKLSFEGIVSIDEYCSRSSVLGAMGALGKEKVQLHESERTVFFEL